MLTTLAVVLAAALAAEPGQASPTKVERHGAVPGALQTPEGRRAFRDQIQRRPGDDGLGTTLPRGLTREAILGHALPPGAVDDRSQLFVGAVPWPSRPDAFIAIVCPVARQSGPRVCDLDPRGQAGAWLAVLSATPGGVALVARTEVPFIPYSDWSRMKDGPAGFDSDAPVVREDQILRFDLAPYRIKTGEVAIGLRTAANEGYSGGGATFESLHLFRIQGSHLVEVFSHPMAWSRMTAGAWFDDGKREHFFTEGALVLAVGQRSTGGFLELTIRPRSGGGPRFLATWDQASERYESRRVE